ncbi:MAG: endonuclease [Archangium sp.]
MKYVVAVVLVMLVGCGPPPVTSDSGTDASVMEDASVQFDSGTPDAGELDAGIDSGTPDAGELDSGTPDAGEVDAGFDAGDVDAGFDGGTPDAGEVDAGFDAGTPDAGFDAGLDAGTDAGAPDASLDFDGGMGCPVPTMQSAPFVLRAMAANLTTGNFQSYDPGHGIRIIAGVKPDIVMIQEFNYGSNTATSLTSLVNQMFPDAGYVYQRGAGSIPNGVVSRWPILAGGEWVDSLTNTRGYTWAHVDLPGPADLWVVSVHLLTANPTVRNNQATALIANLNSMIPATDYVLLGGDLNTDTRDAGQEPCFNTFAYRLVVTGPHPADQNGLEGTNATRTKPYDQVLPSACLRALQIPSVIGTSTYATGAVIDTRVYTPISDLDPALSTDSAGPSMQHMGVVKDFLIQP